MDIAQPDVCYIGGLTRTLRVVEMSRRAGLTIVPHSANLSMVTVFALHLMGAIPNPAPFIEYTIETNDWTDGLYEPVLKVQDGKVAIPTDLAGAFRSTRRGWNQPSGRLVLRDNRGEHDGTQSICPLPPTGAVSLSGKLSFNTSRAGKTRQLLASMGLLTGPDKSEIAPIPLDRNSSNGFIHLPIWMPLRPLIQDSSITPCFGMAWVLRIARSFAGCTPTLPGPQAPR